MSLTYNMPDIWTNFNMLFANLWPFLAIPLGIMIFAVVIALILRIFRGTFMGRIDE